jgi:hypothetical protein
MRTVAEIKQARRALLHGNRFLRDDCHRGADAIIEQTAAFVREQLSLAATTFLTQEPPSRRTQHGAALLDLAACWALTQPAFVKLIHQGIDEAPVPELDHEWARMTRAELDEQLAALERELAEAEREERRRPLLEEKALLDAQLAELES